MGLPCWYGEGRIVLVNPTPARPLFRWEGRQISEGNELWRRTSPRVLAEWNYRSPSRPFSVATGQHRLCSCKAS